VDENQVAVDEGAEVDRPAHAQLLGRHVLARGQPHLRQIGAEGHGKEVVVPGEVDDLAVIARQLPGHGRGL
jgi:hypothetical protein